MTVASLWKVLGAAGAGKAVGTYELVTGSLPSDNNILNTNPCEQQQQQQQQQQQRTYSLVSSKRTSLAVDLSIWICESLTSHAMSENNVNPSLQLVFSRTIKLLSLGIKLIFVIEGKRRIRGDPGEDDKFRKRRSGTAFWKACQDCQQMLQLMGVPVVRAKAEGEALCALLSQRGVVDGVISNDGDCLLFGAKTVYTKFSLENLENSTVIRYDLDKLHAVVEASDDADDGNEVGKKLLMSRYDLIAFALLTGSDLAGNGLSKVGHKKAVRFIRKCQLDNPLSKETASITEMKSWACAATAGLPVIETENKTKGKKCCTRCSHHGSKRSHAKHGCDVCGTGPGEPCYELSSDDRFRKSLRAKALEVQPPFEPSQVVEAYMRPNDNQMPIQFASMSSERLTMGPPRLHQLHDMPLIIKGRVLETSRAYVKEKVARLMARNELFRTDHNLPGTHADCDTRQRLSRERPVPQEIKRMLFQNRAPCYEVSWLVNATLTDDNGDGIDGYEYSTIEPRDLIDKRYPALLEAFQVMERERKKQGDAEQIRRRTFLETILGGAGDDASATGSNDKLLNDNNDDQNNKPNKEMQKQIQKREGFFQRKRPLPMNAHGHRRKEKKKKSKQHSRSRNKCSDDVYHLLGMGNKMALQANSFRHDLNEEPSVQVPREIVVIRKPTKERNGTESKRDADEEPAEAIMAADDESPSGSGLFWNMGGFMVEITPLISSNQGDLPPRHVFVRKEF